MATRGTDIGILVINRYRRCNFNIPSIGCDASAVIIKSTINYYVPATLNRDRTISIISIARYSDIATAGADAFWTEPAVSLLSVRR